MTGCTPGLPPPTGYTTYLAQFCDTLFMEVGAGTGECYEFCVQQLVDSQPHPLALPEAGGPWALAIALVFLALLAHRRG